MIYYTYPTKNPASISIGLEERTTPLITIHEVSTKRQLRQFIDFPVKLYKNNKQFVPSLAIDEAINLNPKKNPAYQYCETKLFLAYKDKKIVGRACALINHAHNEKAGVLDVRFNRFDMIDDITVTQALLDAVEAWGKEKGMMAIVGPIGFCDLDKEGMLVEGFEEKNLFITYYNHPYYPAHLEQLGFIKEVDWVEYQITVPDIIPDRLLRLSEITQKRYGFKIMKFRTKKQMLPYAKQAFVIYNDAFAPLYGTVPLTEPQIDMYIKQFILLVSLDYIFIVQNKLDEVVGVGILAPSLADAIRDSKGRLFPLGWLRILIALRKAKVLDMYFIAVKPEYQLQGVSALILIEGIKAANKNGIKLAETGPELETNIKVQGLWSEFETRRYKRRRVYHKPIR